MFDYSSSIPTVLNPNKRGKVYLLHCTSNPLKLESNTPDTMLIIINGTFKWYALH